jgi:hypothetical protein
VHRALIGGFVPAGAAYAAALAGFGFLVVAPATGHLDPAVGVPFVVGALHAVVLIAVAPSLARAGRAPDGRAWIRMGVLTVAGALALLVVGSARGAAVGVLLGLFGATLLAVRDGLTAVGVREAWARLVPVVLGGLLLTSLSWSGPLIEASGHPSAGVDLVVRLNPLAAAAGGALGLDWALMRPVTYDQFVGQYHPFAYAGLAAVLAGWALAAAVLEAPVLLVARRRVR